jgi:hypothetical protein
MVVIRAEAAATGAVDITTEGRLPPFLMQETAENELYY